MLNSINVFVCDCYNGYICKVHFKNGIMRKLIHYLKERGQGKWDIRAVACELIGLRPERCKTDEFFEFVVGMSPTSLVVGSRSGNVSIVQLTDTYVFIHNVGSKEIRILNKVNSTIVNRHVYIDEGDLQEEVNNFCTRTLIPTYGE